VKRSFQMIMISLWLTAASFPLMADGQGWLNNSATFKIDARWSLKLTNEARHHEVTFKDSFLKNWQAGLVYRLPRNFYASVLYKRESTDKPLFVLAENRFTLETGWKTGLAENWDFDWRFRTEIRRYDDERADNHLRFRLRVRLRTQLRIGTLTIKPFIGTEPFGDTLVDGINRNRFYLGAVFPMGEHAGLVINYIRQDTKDKETLHIINSGFDLSF
jgi:uncharacterized protein DUF2490